MTEIQVAARNIASDQRLELSFPIEDIVSTNLVMAGSFTQLPTLTSVERIIARLSGLGLVLAQERETETLAELVNRNYLPVNPASWQNSRVELEVIQATIQDHAALSAINEIRGPILKTAETSVSAQIRKDLGSQRTAETALVDHISGIVRRDSNLWTSALAKIMRFVARTVLESLVAGMIGVPLVDLLRVTLSGAVRRYGV
jgi:hypothetical protein